MLMLFCLLAKAAVATMLCLKWLTNFQLAPTNQAIALILRPYSTHNWIQCAAQFVLSHLYSSFISQEKASMVLP